MFIRNVAEDDWILVPVVTVQGVVFQWQKEARR